MVKFFIILSIGLFTILPLVNGARNCDCTPNINNRIVNGQKAENHEFPWQVSLGLKRGNKVYHICGATILNDLYVVTASHCVVSKNIEPKDYVIGFGSNDLEEMTLDKRIPAEKIMIHPLYTSGKPSSKGDIALIKLSRTLNLTDNVKPACLIKDVDTLNDILEDQPDQIFTASGWGSVKKTWKYLIGSLRGGQIDRHLKKADFKHVQEDEKNNLCKGRPDLLCIKPVTKGDSVCNGDSGGPLTTIVQTSSNDSSTPNFQNNKLAVVGVTSFGNGAISYPIPIYVTFCNGEAAYTNIPYFNDFITSHINEEDLCMI